MDGDKDEQIMRRNHQTPMHILTQSIDEIANEIISLLLTKELPSLPYGNPQPITIKQMRDILSTTNDKIVYASDHYSANKLFELKKEK